MLYKIVAALLLIPSTFVIYDNVWSSAKNNGIKIFFSYAARKAPAVIFKRGFLYNCFVYYPARIAVEILRRNSWQFVGRKLFLQLRKLFCNPADLNVSLENEAPVPLKLIDIVTLSSLVEQPSVQVVSFDIFDTLLLRPVYHPKDIFQLVAKKVDQKYSIDFFGMRVNAEEKLNNDFATLEDIYSGMKRDFGLSDAISSDLLKEELECEKVLLRPREDMLRVYQQAERAGKRIIAISDMYLPSTFLKETLHSKGFTQISEVYVSCEHHARKSSGKLFDYVMSLEGISGNSIIHIGDNYQSDYCAAIQRGVAAFHYPSVMEIARAGAGRMWQYFDHAAQRDPFLGMLIAHSINDAFASATSSPPSLDNIKDLNHFSSLILGPWTTGICLNILNNHAIQNGYEKIFFASRDGWLPSKVYEVLRSCSSGIESRYFYAGRRAYLPFMCRSLIECAQRFKGVDQPDKYTFEQFLVAHLGKFSTQVLSSCSEDEKKIIFFENKALVLCLLERLHDQIDSVFNIMRKNAAAYYASVFAGKSERCICFDVGYSGSISRALSEIVKKPIDKIYCWESLENKKYDKINNTITHCLMHGTNFQPYNLILEELFSPLEGSVTGFDEGGGAVIEDLCCDRAFASDMKDVSASALEFASSFCGAFGVYTKFFENIHLDSYLDITCHLLKDLSNSALFKNITFSDPMYCAEIPSLAQKIEAAKVYTTVFSGTGFENKAKVQTWPILDVGTISKVGVHLHMYNVLLAQECLLYLQQIPFQFDLLITTPFRDSKNLLSTIFSTAAVSRVRQVSVVTVPNRGRDVAPWLIDFGKVHHQYDLCCHLHTKESNHFDFGARWRKYLFDNLIRSDSAQLAVSVMQQDPQIGCIFPAIYSELKRFMIENEVPLLGIDGEDHLIKTVIKKLNLGSNFCKDDIFFSAGTMMWYRPHALRQLFEGFMYEDFPEEPIGVGGTLAHAIERIPPLVASRNGYTVRSLTRYPS